jgi:quaternary ammonium compound-resistance protein SugE
LIGSNKVVIGTPVSLIRRVRAAKRGHLKAGLEILLGTARFRGAGRRRQAGAILAGFSVEQEQSMSWIYLAVAGLLEVAWAVGLKYTAGFTRLWPSVFTLATMAGSVGMLGLALRSLPLGTAYAVWTGIGTIGTAVAGMVLLGEPAGALRLLSIGLIAAGIVGLKLLTPA